jgi:hypothetical protein
MNLELIKITNNSFLKRRKTKVLTKFSDISAAGSYDFISQVIQLNSIEKHHIDELSAKKNDFDMNHYNIAKKILPLLAHEQTHWVDNTSTLWGFEFLDSIYESLRITTSDQINRFSEYEFYKKKSLYNAIHCIRYPKYYSTIGSSEGAPPWIYQYSMGKLFDSSGKPSEYPVFFTRFEDTNGNLVSREPFALCSLLESSATYQEILTEAALIRQMLKEGEILVENKLLSKKYLSRVYDRHLTEYSIAAHKISNELKLTDIIDAYGISASLSHLSLNFLTDYFELIDPEVIYGKDHAFLDGIKVSLKAKDRAVLYILFCDAVSARHKVTPVTRDNLRHTIESILSDFDISLEEMAKKVEDRMVKISTNICTKYRDNYSTNLALEGLDRFKKLGIMAEGRYPLEELGAPGAILGDDYYLNPFGYSDTEYEDRFLNAIDFMEHLNSFSEACIYNA